MRAMAHRYGSPDLRVTRPSPGYIYVGNGLKTSPKPLTADGFSKKFYH
jgi:hypothetical protein